MLRLTAGAYANIHLLHNFGDAVSSVRFNPPHPDTHAIRPIRLVVELYQHINFGGDRIVIVESSSNLILDFGTEFNDVTSSVRVRRGPDFAAGNVAQLHRDVNFLGGKIDLAPGDYPNLITSHGFNDVASSIRV